MIKRRILALLAVLLFLSIPAHAMESSLIDMRNKIFAESNTLKPLLKNSADVLLVSSMWDSCLMATMQLDAYFSMIGIFNSIQKDNLTGEVFTYIIDWLGMMKESNRLNVKALNSVTETSEPKVKLSVEKLKKYFTELNSRIDAGTAKLLALKEWIRK